MPKVGTLGYGADVGYRASEQIGVRGMWREFNHGFDFEAEGEDIDGDIDLGSYGAVLDYYPTGQNFRISGGLLDMSNSVGLDTTVEETVQVSGMSVERSADVDGEIEYKGVAPILSVGWHANLTERVTYDLSLGAVFGGKPDVSLRSTGGTGAGNPDIEREIDDIEDEIENHLDAVSVYPVIEFGVAYHF
ncbi:hypothetical protein Salmuc_01743 [Salipiger mucosus DSM 16094]|uniref:Outer membrane protein beta-barrel domain-containing protein n=2 Tax=Salipiger mucosus TaxID=263378 RepID=S9QWH8_9RHOB|nr:hypothetical protein Salmuc_01743 [Salipiger mucosus DSM 16094]